MSTGNALSKTDTDNAELSSDTKEFLTVVIAGQRFGIPILQIQDVLRAQNITKVPLAPDEIAGSLNLRGRIVTAIDVRRRLDFDPSNDSLKDKMSVVVEHGIELYSLIIDNVGDVLQLGNDQFEKNPATLDPVWRDISMGIYRLDGELLVILDIPKLIDTVNGGENNN